MHLQGAVRAHQPRGHRRAGGDQGGGPAGARTDLAILLIRDKDALGLVASTYKESAAAQALFDRPGRLYTGHHNNLYKGLVQELKKLEMQDQDNSDAIDKLLERIGMFPNLPTVFDGLDKLGIDSYRARAGQDGGQNGLAQHLRCPQVLRQVHREAPSQRFLCGVGAVDLFLFACLLIL